MATAKPRVALHEDERRASAKVLGDTPSQIQFSQSLSEFRETLQRQRELGAEVSKQRDQIYAGNPSIEAMNAFALAARAKLSKIPPELRQQIEEFERAGGEASRRVEHAQANIQGILCLLSVLRSDESLGDTNLHGIGEALLGDGRYRASLAEMADRAEVLYSPEYSHKSDRFEDMSMEELVSFLTKRESDYSRVYDQIMVSEIPDLGLRALIDRISSGKRIVGLAESYERIYTAELEPKTAELHRLSGRLAFIKGQYPVNSSEHSQLATLLVESADQTAKQ